MKTQVSKLTWILNEREKSPLGQLFGILSTSV